MTFLLYLVWFWFGGVVLSGGFLAKAMSLGGPLVAQALPLSEQRTRMFLQLVFSVVAWPIVLTKMIAAHVDPEVVQKQFEMGFRASIGRGRPFEPIEPLPIKVEPPSPELEAWFAKSHAWDLANPPPRECGACLDAINGWREKRLAWELENPIP